MVQEKLESGQLEWHQVAAFFSFVGSAAVVDSVVPAHATRATVLSVRSVPSGRFVRRSVRSVRSSVRRSGRSVYCTSRRPSRPVPRPVPSPGPAGGQQAKAGRTCFCSFVRFVRSFVSFVPPARRSVRPSVTPTDGRTHARRTRPPRPTDVSRMRDPSIDRSSRQAGTQVGRVRWNSLESIEQASHASA